MSGVTRSIYAKSVFDLMTLGQSHYAYSKYSVLESASAIFRSA
jgi:hypothetical protein